MTFEDITAKIQHLAATKGGVGRTIKFQTDQGPIVVYPDGQVNNQDAEADTTIGISVSDLNKLMAGELNPMTAVMFGKIKISGDMGVAMQLQSLF
jgi:putative sterol carrier protein